MGTYLILFVGSAIACGLLKFRNRWNANPLGLPHPPGPKGYPIIGATLDVPLKSAWLTYDEWAKKYGDMVFFEALGQPFLVLSSLKRTTDLFDKRSSKYSGRPRLPMLVELMNWGWALGMMPYGHWWRRNRKAFHQHFNMNQVYEYNNIQVRETRLFLRRLLKTPDDFKHHTHHLFAAIVMTVSYGISVQETDDPYILMAHEVVNSFSDAAVPGKYLVDIFPVMKYIPSWFPGAGWKRKAKVYRELNQLMLTKTFEFVKREIANGTARPSVASSLINDLPEEGDPRREEEEAVAKGVSATGYIAGADTTIGAVLTFILAMCLYPEVQKKAHAELDRVLNDRLPEFSDRPSLPYIEAILKEVNRWHLIAPLGFYHSTTEDDEYDGYFIPKGTLVIGNSWTILHNPDIYHNPEQFLPERFLKDGQINPDVQDPSVASFGFGRRICPGRHLSDSSLFIIVTSLLSVFDINPPLGEDGKPVEIRPVFNEDALSPPAPFQASIKPRSRESSEVILNSELPV